MYGQHPINCGAPQKTARYENTPTAQVFFTVPYIITIAYQPEWLMFPEKIVGAVGNCANQVFPERDLRVAFAIISKNLDKFNGSLGQRWLCRRCKLWRFHFRFAFSMNHPPNQALGDRWLFFTLLMSRQ